MQTREPVVAGMFYHMDPDSLREQLSSFFSAVKTKPEYRFVISPHAGYEYSGMTAAFAVASLMPAKRFLILGPNHSGRGAEFSVMGEGLWKTPLGDCRIDSELAKELKKIKFLEEDALAHKSEHSIEVQLPFLQYRFGLSLIHI